MPQSKIIFSNGDLISLNPTNMQEVGRVQVTAVAAVPQMIARASEAQREWAQLSVRERGHRLRPLADYLHDEVERFADIISCECGKPKIEAISSDIFPVMMHVNYLAAKAPQYLRDESLPDYWLTWAMGKRGRITYEPYGVVAVISPWNYPFWLTAGPVLSALVAGNAVIAKPSEFTPLSGDLVRQLIEQLDLPKHLFQMAQGDGRVGAALVQAGVNKIVFTGSSSTGRKIMAQAAPHLTPVTMELGGVDAAIILADANLERASSGIVWGGFTCAGQVCASVERVYVAESVAAQFSQLVVEKTKSLRVCSELDNTDVGPMNNERQLAIVERQVNEAVARGARVLVGGKAEASEGLFFPPTVLDNVPHDTELMQSETFGPVLAIQKVKNVDEAIRLTNSNSTGLTASIWTRDTHRAEQLARELQVGTVSINDHLSIAGFPDVPWGGMKESGFGRLQGRLGLMEMVAPKVVVRDVLPLKRPWWYGYDDHTYRVFTNLMTLLTQKSIGQKLNAVVQLLKNFKVRKLM